MKRDSKYLAILGLTVIILVTIQLFIPKPLDWMITFNRNDKNPYGGYILNSIMEELFPTQRVSYSTKTIYELTGVDPQPSNLIIICDFFHPDSLDSRALFQSVSQGQSVFIAANFFGGFLADSLQIETDNLLFQSGLNEVFTAATKLDSIGIFFKNPYLKNVGPFFYQGENIPDHFISFDSSRVTVIAENNHGMPILIKIEMGEGFFLLSSTPLAFTNYHLIGGENYVLAESVLSFLPALDLHWTEYYQLGKLEAATPLRFVLTNPSLKWAYYITILTLILFMLFEAKRKQRAIPVIKPPLNSTLEFIRTLGNLYYRERNHRHIVQKRILYFKDFIYHTYNLPVNYQPGFYEKLAAKTGKDIKEIESIFETIQKFQKMPRVKTGELYGFNKKLEKFYQEKE